MYTVALEPRPFPTNQPESSHESPHEPKQALSILNGSKRKAIPKSWKLFPVAVPDCRFAPIHSPTLGGTTVLMDKSMGPGTAARRLAAGCLTP